MMGVSMCCLKCELAWWQVSLALGRLCPFCGSAKTTSEGQA